MKDSKIAGTAVFILYKNQKQTIFSNIQEVDIIEGKILLNRSAEDSIVIDLGTVHYYKVY